MTATTAGALLYPPQKKNTWGSIVGYQEPSGAKEEQEALLGLSSEAEVHSGHDVMSGALIMSPSKRFHFLPQT